MAHVLQSKYRSRTRQTRQWTLSICRGLLVAPTICSFSQQLEKSYQNIHWILLARNSETKICENLLDTSDIRAVTQQRSYRTHRWHVSGQVSWKIEWKLDKIKSSGNDTRKWGNSEWKKEKCHWAGPKIERASGRRFERQFCACRHFLRLLCCATWCDCTRLRTIAVRTTRLSSNMTTRASTPMRATSFSTTITTTAIMVTGSGAMDRPIWVRIQEGEDKGL